MGSLVDLVKDIKTAMDALETGANLALARGFQRKASYYIVGRWVMSVAYL